ncbi:SGNH/GDSL hydrolase family protein, partial [Acinetobacter baumannii]
VVKFFAFTASNTSQNLGITVQVNSGATYPVQVGAYNDGGGWNWLLPSNGWKIGATLINAQHVGLNTEISNINKKLDVLDPVDLNIFKPKLNASKNGLKVTIDGVFKEFTSQYNINSMLTHDAAASGTTTVNTTLKLCASNQYWVSNPNAWLGYHWLSNVTVKRTDTNATLTLGVDYSVDYFGGKLYSPVLDNIPVSVTFDYKKERYDLIQYNFLTRSISIVKGTERIHDAQEYMPNFSVGNKPLFTVLVVGNEIKGLQPLYKTNGIGGSFYNEPTELTAIRTHNSKCLRKTFKKLANGSAIKLAGYGDSITAINGGTDTTSPNGNRDLLSYPMTNLPRETVELYSEITTDSFGEHVKIGWNWYLKSLFESKFGSAVTYLNYGLSGFNSTQAASSTYLDNVVASSPDLAVICLGMNDLTDTRLYSNLITIANALKNVGSEVVIMPVPRTPLFDKPQFNGSNSMMSSAEDYNLNVSRCYQAALDSGSAFVPAHLYFGHDQDNSVGLYHMHYCSSNLVNHPGLHELKIYGKLLCSLFD